VRPPDCAEATGAATSLARDFDGSPALGDEEVYSNEENTTSGIGALDRQQLMIRVLRRMRHRPRCRRPARSDRWWFGVSLAALCLLLAASCTDTGSTAAGTDAGHTAETTPAPSATLVPLISPRPQFAAAGECRPYHGNPWGYDFCAERLVTSPPAQFCDYFKCIEGFWSTLQGYVVECENGEFSRAGGYPGVCGYHGGIRRTLYSHGTRP
jgi:hypothetical protein